MKLGIRIWIFLPVLLLLICFPIGTIGVFTLTSNWYMQHSAGKQVNAMSVYIQEEAETLFGTELLPVSLDPKTARNHAKELVSNIREYIRTAPTTTQIAIFNSHHAQTSASASNINATSEIPAEYWAALLAEDQLSPQQTTFLSYETVNYAVQLYIVPTVHNIKAKYFIIYEEIPDAAPLLTQTKEMIFLITILLSCVFAGVFWIITGNIVKPINEFSKHTATVGCGTPSLQQTHYLFRELEELRLSFIKMEETLEQTQKEKETIFQNISHDLRTPLVSIIGYADALCHNTVTNPQKAAGIILEESKRMNHMVDNILLLSKLDSHSWTKHFIPISLDDLLDEQTDALQYMNTEKQLIYISRDGFETESSPIIVTDPELLIRILQNIISNCLRHASTMVQIILASNAHTAVISIEDDGPGIPPEELPHIFKRHYHGIQGHSGIGLSIVQTGMEYLGGQVEVYNKTAPESGAVYLLSLPLAMGTVSEQVNI